MILPGYLSGLCEYERYGAAASYLNGGITMENIKTATCNGNLPPGASGHNRLDKSSTYKVDGKTFIVEPVFQADGHDTLGTILIKLMRADADRL